VSEYVSGKVFEKVMLALPPLRVPVPRRTEPQWNVTCSPSGGGPFEELTVAVTVMGWFTTAGFSAEVSVVFVVSSTT
jgi:hypothetical protein